MDALEAQAHFGDGMTDEECDAFFAAEKKVRDYNQARYPKRTYTAAQEAEFQKCLEENGGF